MLSDISIIYVVLCCFKIKIFCMNKSKAVHFLVLLCVKKYSISLSIKTGICYLLVTNYMFMTKI